MGRQAKLKANRRKNLIKRKVKLPFGGKNCDIQVVRRFNLEDFRVENWDVSLERNIFDGNIDIWIDCSDSIPGIPLYFIDSCRLEPTMTVPRKNAWNVIAANREFQEDLASNEDIFWFGITQINSGTVFFDYTLKEAFDKFVSGANQEDNFEMAIANILIKLFAIKRKNEGLRSLFFVIDSSEEETVSKPTGGSMFFIR